MNNLTCWLVTCRPGTWSSSWSSRNHPARTRRGRRRGRKPTSPVGSAYGRVTPALRLAPRHDEREFSHGLMWTAGDSKIFFQRRFCLAEVSLFRRRPETARAPRAAAVRHGRRPPPEAARSVLDRGEHDANLDWAGALSCRRRLPRPFRKRRSLSAKIRSVAPLCPGL